MTGQAPEIAPYAEPESQDPAPITQDPQDIDRRRQLAKERITRALMQNAKWNMAVMLRNDSGTKPLDSGAGSAMKAVRAAQPKDDRSDWDKANDLALQAVHRTLTTPETAGPFFDWLTGKTDDDYKQSFDDKLTEYGDVKMAKKWADDHAYKPPFPLLDDPENEDLAPFDIGKLQLNERGGTSAFRDYVTEPLARYMTGRAQPIADSIVGITNLVSKIPGLGSVKLPARDVYTSVSAVLGGGEGSIATKRRLAEIRKSQYDDGTSFAAGLLQGGTELFGNMQGVVKGIGGASAFNLGVKGGSVIGSRLVSSSPSWLRVAGRGAAGFGAHHFLTANGGDASMMERLDEGLKGAAAGVIAEGATAVGRAAFRGIIGRAFTVLPRVGSKPGVVEMGGKSVLDKLYKFASSQKIMPKPGENAEDYMRRAIGRFVDAGAPGVEMPARRLVAHGTAALLEAGAFSAVDLHFWSDAYEAVWNKDPKARDRLLNTYMQSVLAMGLGRAGGEFKLLKERQRSIPTNPGQSPGSGGAPRAPQDPQLPPGSPSQPLQLGSPPADTAPRQIPRVSKTASDQAAAEMRNAAQGELKDQQVGERFAPDGAPSTLRSPIELSKQTNPESSLAAESILEQQSNTPIELGYREPNREMLKLGWSPEIQSRSDYKNESAQRSYRAEQLGSVQKEAVSVRINGFGAQEAKRYVPQDSDLYKALDSLGETGGEVMISPELAAEIAKRLADEAPRLRARFGDDEANPRIQTVDSFISRVMEAYGLDPVKRAPKPEKAPAEGKVEPSEGEAVPAEKAQEPQEPETPPDVVRLMDSPFSYEVQGEIAIPSPALREATGLPEMPLPAFEEVLGKLTLADRLIGKAILPGEEIDAWTGVKAEVKDDVGVMRSLRFGELVESPLGPEPKWTKVNNVPIRQPDPIGPQQEQVKQFLEQLAGRDDLAPEDHRILGASIGVMSTVGAEVDKSVAEAIGAMQHLAPMMSLDPQTAGEAIKAFGEILTNKSPDVAINDMLTNAEQHLAKREAEMASERERKLSRKHARQEKKQARRDSREGERGAALSNVLTAPIDLLAEGLARVIDTPPIRWFGEDQQGRIDRKEGADTSRRIRRAITATVEMRRSLHGPVEQLMRLGAATPELQRKHWTQIDQRLSYGPDGLQLFRESRLMQDYGVDRSTLTPASLAQLRAMDQAYRETRERAHDLGFEMENVFDPVTGNRVRIARESQQHVMVQQPTEFARRMAATLNPDFLEVMAHFNGTDPISMANILEREGWTGAQGLSRPDAIENSRSFMIPAWMRIGNREYRLLETRPVAHTQRLINRFAMRAGVVQEFGQGFRPVGQGAQAAMANYVPYQDVVNQAMPENRQELADFLRRASGRHNEQDSAAEQWFREHIGPFLGAINSLKLTGLTTSAQNIVEFTGAPLAVYGPVRIVRAVGETLLDLVTANFGRTRERLADTGGFLPESHEPGIETIRERAGFVSRLARTLFNATQEFADVITARANERLVDEMRAGRAGRDGEALAMAVGGYSPQDAERISRGQGTQDEYDFLLENAVGRLHGRGQHRTDTSKGGEFARRLYTPFLPHVQRMTGIAIRLSKAVKAARTQSERDSASIALLKFLGATAIQGHIARALGAWIVNGWDDAKDKLIPDSVGEAASDLAIGTLTGLFGGAGATLIGGLEAIFSSGDQQGEAMVRAVGSTSTAASALIEIGSFVVSLTSDTAETEYRGHSMLGKFAILAERLAPIVRNVDRGLGGAASLALTSDPDVRLARTKMFKWKEDNNIPFEGGGEPSEFGTYMRQFKLEMKDPKQIEKLDAGEIARRIIDGLPEGKGIKNAVQSLKTDLQLAWLRKQPEDVQQEFRKNMGDKHVRTLEGYDRMVWSVIDRLDPPELK